MRDESSDSFIALFDGQRPEARGKVESAKEERVLGVFSGGEAVYGFVAARNWGIEREQLAVGVSEVDCRFEFRQSSSSRVPRGYPKRSWIL